MKCPLCGSTHKIHRSHRRSPAERLLGVLLLIRPFRCLDCGKRFWRLRFQPH